MAKNREELRQEIIRTYGFGRLLTTTSNGADGTEVIVSGDADANLSTLAHRGKWIWSVPDAEERRVAPSGFDVSTGKYTVAPAFGTTPQTGEKFELWEIVRPSRVNEAINRALERHVGWRAWDTSITLVSTDTRYELPSWVKSENDVREVYVIPASSSLEREYPLPVQWWRVQPFEDTNRVRKFYLFTRPLSAGYTLVLQADRHYDPLTDETTDTEAPIEWVAAQATVELLLPLLWRAAREGDQGITFLYQAAVSEARKWENEYLPPVGRRLMGPVPVDFLSPGSYPPF
jgi:hypothetical protein